MRMSSQKATLWDMDGVLADTSALHFETWENVLNELDIPFDRQKFLHIFGLKNDELVAYLVGKPLEPGFVKRVSDQKEAAFRQAISGHIQLLPGVKEWIERFRSWNWKQAVASSAPIENIEAVVDELGIRNNFLALVSPDNLPGKPNPAVFLKAARQLGVSPENCIVIEDSLAGVEAAHRARMHCIAVTTTNPPEALSQADIVIETLDQLTVEEIVKLAGLGDQEMPLVTEADA